MAFRLPTFNVTVNIWRSTNSHTNPPDVVTVGNLSPGRLVSVSGTNPFLVAPGSIVAFMLLRLPPLTDIEDGILSGTLSPDQVEVPAGSGRFYRSVYVDDIAKGFANEHRFAYVVKGSIPWPVPYP